MRLDLPIVQGLTPPRSLGHAQRPVESCNPRKTPQSADVRSLGSDVGLVHFGGRVHELGREQHGQIRQCTKLVIHWLSPTPTESQAERPLKRRIFMHA